MAALVCSFAASADALHGFCSDCVVDDMIGGVPVTSTGTNPPLNFGFWSGGPSGLTGNYMIDILTPDNGGTAPSIMYSISGGMNGTATAGLFSSTAWTSQNTHLDSYLGLSASPQNPLGAWLPATQTLDPNAMGYWVFQANLGSNTLGTATGTGPMLSLGSSLPEGSLIVAFLSGSSSTTATANSSAIFETGAPSSVPEPAPLVLMVAGFMGLAITRMRRRKAA
jgi:hypothetical protein